MHLFGHNLDHDYCSNSLVKGSGTPYPMVSFCSEKFLICFAAAVLTFFIAGLLYLLCFKARR